jgi:hypothetical protein
MKKTFSILGMTILILSLCFAFAGCDPDNENGNDNGIGDDPWAGKTVDIAYRGEYVIFTGDLYYATWMVLTENEYSNHGNGQLLQTGKLSMAEASPIGYITDLTDVRRKAFTEGNILFAFNSWNVNPFEVGKFENNTFVHASGSIFHKVD